MGIIGAIALDRKKRASLQAQLAFALKREIQTGSLAPGHPIPSSRELASDLAVSRNTVVNACDQLLSEGYLEARPRSGLYVAESLAGLSAPASGTKPLSQCNVLPRERVIAGPRAFRPCQPDVRLFPLVFWNRLRARMLKKHGLPLLTYQSDAPLGWPLLCKAIASYLQDRRSVRCSWEQIAVTSGSQQALYLLAQILLDGTKRTVMLEDPGYPGALQAFHAAGATVIPVPVDGDGIVPPERIPSGAVLYATPSRQFPTGAALTVSRRLALLKAAQKADAWIIEDDYDSEFRYTRPPMPSLHSLDAAGRVIYVGSMSKVLLPALRIGYAVLPPKLTEPFASLRSIVDDHGPLIDQATLAEFIAGGTLYTHIRRCRREYRARLDVFLETARTLRLPWEFAHTDGGMNLCGLLQASRKRQDREISGQALAYGVEAPAISSYAINSSMQGLLFGFTAFEPSVIRASLRRLSPLG